MKKWQFCILAIVLFFIGNLFISAQEDIEEHPSCSHCGMNRQMFAHSRMVILYDDGTSVGLCSIRCAAVDLDLNEGKTPESIRVSDYNTKELVDAEKATWVVGGSKSGVMTKKAKWAFFKLEDAENFIKENGGEITDFDTALKAAKAELSSNKKRER